MPIRVDSRKVYAFDDGTPTPACRMCGKPRRRVNIGMRTVDHVAPYCGGNQCISSERICQRFGCGTRFEVAPGVTKFCAEHTAKVVTA